MLAGDPCSEEEEEEEEESHFLPLIVIFFIWALQVVRHLIGALSCSSSSTFSSWEIYSRLTSIFSGPSIH